mgnify:CR=1 FL=1
MGSLGQGKLQQKIDSARAKIGKKKGTERVLTSDIAGYTRRIRRLQGKIGSLQTRQQTLQADLDRKKAVLVATQAELRSERARLARLRARLVVVRRALSQRLVEMYKAEKPDVLTVVLNSEGFADLLSRGEFIARIADQDREILTIVRTAQRDAKATEKRLDKLEKRQQAVTAQRLEADLVAHGLVAATPDVGVKFTILGASSPKGAGSTERTASTPVVL